MIPKIIHYIWIGSELPKKYKNNIETWKINKDFEIKKWDEKPFIDNKWVKFYCDEKIYSYPGDYIRFKVLYDYGGFYLDTDVICHKPFDDFILNKDFAMSYTNRYYGLINATIIGAEKGNKHIKLLLDTYSELEPTLNILINLNNRKIPNSSDFICSKVLFSNAIFLPEDVFLNNTDNQKPTNNTYCEHILRKEKTSFNNLKETIKIYS